MSLSDDAAQVGTAIAKMASVWGSVAWGVLTLHNIGVFLAAAYSALQIFVLWRDRIREPHANRWYHRRSRA